jgi:hypothetical protein
MDPNRLIDRILLAFVLGSFVVVLMSITTSIT